MKLPLRGFKKPLDTKWLIWIPLLYTAALSGLALAALLHSKGWDIYSWQGLLSALVIMVGLIWFNMTPLLIVEQILDGRARQKQR